MKLRGIPVVHHGYGTRDKEGFLGDYVGLSFRSKPIMMREWSATPVVFEVRGAALLGRGTIFVPGNSASSAFAAANLRAMVGAEALRAVLADGIPAPQAEAWVLGSVPRIALTAVHVATSATADALNHARFAGMPSVRVSPQLFRV
jgi:hypothetical protein